MTNVNPPNGPAVLVSWVSVGAGPAPILAALAQPSPLAERLQTLYLCWRDTAESRDRAAVDETLAALRPLNISVVEVPWTTTAQPTDHAAIRPFAEEVLLRVRRENRHAHIYLHMSPGTPAMHSIWLVLGATGFVTGPLTMIQSIPADKRNADDPPILAIPFEVDTWLRRFREARPRVSVAEDDGQLWDPTELTEHGKMRGALQQLREWADLSAPVLLLGERGTGKSTLANYLRAMGPFQRCGGGPWPSVVCGQFHGDPQRARSELFGHSKGAFTGADRERKGLLEEAEGDCLFLDEIADLDRDTQRLLMAALEGRGFHRLGDGQRRSSSFRLICATNRPLEQLAGGLLDADFFDRIAIFTLAVPALRECGPDLPVFWHRVLGQVAARSGVSIDIESHATDRSLLARMVEHPLPGNLRDLQRIAWHLIAQIHAGASNSEAIDRALATLDVVRSSDSMVPDIEALRARLPLVEPLPDLLNQLRNRWVEAAMAQTDGNQSAAARLLNVKRETLKGWLN
jgi:DNA-binding NtrC family response regulator